MKNIYLIGLAILLTACSREVASNEMETITDNDTNLAVELIEPVENSLLLEWSSDAMDRGNHDYDTFAHSELVVDLDYSGVNRGDVIYYKTPASVLQRYPQSPEDYIGRVVGLPGETVEIKEGQVFIDGKILETFYGKATIYGMGEEEYFERTDTSKHENLEDTREYFTTNMEPVKVIEDTVFVLVDQWWRGTDSRDFGVLPIEKVEGKVLGYKK